MSSRELIGLAADAAYTVLAVAESDRHIDQPTAVAVAVRFMHSQQEFDDARDSGDDDRVFDAAYRLGFLGRAVLDARSRVERKINDDHKRIARTKQRRKQRN